MSAKLRIAADPDTCIAAGLCAAEAPEIFGQQDDGTVLVLTDLPAAQQEAAARSAAELCPSGAIKIIET
jgi:ferredoxin